jgi:hypothetical protein
LRSTKLLFGMPRAISFNAGEALRTAAATGNVDMLRNLIEEDKIHVDSAVNAIVSFRASNPFLAVV